MKYYYEILIALVIIIALTGFVMKHLVISIGGIAIFFIGCFIEYILNRKSKL